jgi:hypothetical protein
VAAQRLLCRPLLRAADASTACDGRESQRTVRGPHLPNKNPGQLRPGFSVNE